MAGRARRAGERPARPPGPAAAAKAKRLAAERVPLEVYEARELAEMSRDMYGDRSGFAAARRAFVTKAKPAETPARLRLAATRPARARSLAAARPATVAPSCARRCRCRREPFGHEG